MTFQGGFVGQDALVETGCLSSTSLQPLVTIYGLMDNNDRQSFSLAPCDGTAAKPCRYMKISFPSSTDFYGRVTVYSLQVFGCRALSSNI
jgi:hypothetical protein